MATQPRDMTSQELKAETDRLVALIGKYETDLADFRLMLQTTRAELEKRTRPQPAPRVSDHALMRFTERILGIDLEAFRARILTDDVKNAIQMGAVAVTVEGVRLKIEGNTIVTVMGKPERKRLPKERSDHADDDEHQYAEQY